MKYAVVLILCIVSSQIFGQGIYGQHLTNPVVYLNSITIDWDKLHLNVNNIDSMKIERKTERGEIYIKTKTWPSFLTLGMVLKKYTTLDDSLQPVIYTIDGKLVNDTTNVRIDKSFYIDVVVNRFDTVNYIAEQLKGLVIVEIKLSKEKPTPNIRIRGPEGPEAEN